MADDIYVTVETQQVAEVSAVGIQGLSATTGNLGDITDVDTTILADGSVLVYDATALKWKSTIFLEKQDITGGHF